MRLAKGSIAVGLTTLLVTTGLSFTANGADGDVAQSNSSAITATGLTEIVNSQQCTASSPDGTPVEEGEGTCGVGLGVSQPAVTSFDQTASTSLDGNKGVSTADAEVAGTGIDALTTIDLSSVADDIRSIDTGTVLDPLLGGLGDALTDLLALLGISLDDILGDVQDAVTGPLLAAVQDALPVSAQIGAVTSTCDATAGSAATGNATVAGIDLIVDLGGGNTLTVPIDLDTSPNAALVGSVAPQELVDGLLDGVEATLTESITGALEPIADLIDDLQAQVIDPILEQVGTALLDPVGDALSPILEGTVNKQVADGEAIEVTALDLNVLGDAATLAIGRTSCGPNALVAADDADAVADADADADAVADADADADAVADADANADANADGTIADADSAADADVAAALPNTGGDSQNLWPFFLLGLALLLFGLAVLANERRRLAASA